MNQIKSYYPLQSLIITAIIALSGTTSNAITLPATLQNSAIAARQKAGFAKVMAGALWNHARGKTSPHTIIENKLQHIYNATQFNPETDAANLYKALANNNTVTNPQNFDLGTSSSALQVEGGLDATSAAARFYKDKAHLPTPGDAIDFYHNYPTLIPQMKKELNISTFRLSLAWNRIQPQQNVFDAHAIEYYRDVIRTLLANDIKPMIVFHHYDVPTWFEDLGGFELEENGKLFQQFCLTVYTALAQELGECLISMCNAPEGPAFKGYFTGEGTPGEKDNIQKTHTVIANMYYELVDTALEIQKIYAQLKQANPTLQKPCIGTQVNVLLFDPHHSSQSNWKNTLETLLGCAMASYIQSEGVFNFLVNGHYAMYTPDADFMKTIKGLNVYRYHKDAYKAFDWIGVNIYSNRYFNGSTPITGDELIEEDEERYTDNPNYRNYPEGIYRAVQLITERVAGPLGKLRNKDGRPLPIIITENGIATKDDAKRTRYFQRALATITTLVRDGYPVIGYLPWTSHDNYEWPTAASPEGFDSKCYGFFAINRDKNSPDYLTATLKEGSRYYADFARAFPSIT